MEAGVANWEELFDQAQWEDKEIAKKRGGLSKKRYLKHLVELQATRLKHMYRAVAALQEQYGRLHKANQMLASRQMDPEFDAMRKVEDEARCVVMPHLGLETALRDLDKWRPKA